MNRNIQFSMSLTFTYSNRHHKKFRILDTDKNNTGGVRVSNSTNMLEIKELH